MDDKPYEITPGMREPANARPARNWRTRRRRRGIHRPSRVTVEGDQQVLEPLLLDGVYRIARGLLRNAFRRTHGRQFEAEIRY